VAKRVIFCWLRPDKQSAINVSASPDISALRCVAQLAPIAEVKFPRIAASLLLRRVIKRERMSGPRAPEER
jgi:hypothetical protein